MDADDFYYGGWHLFDALDALIGQDRGYSDLSDAEKPDLQTAVATFLCEMGDASLNVAVSQYVRRFLTDEMIADGYGLPAVLAVATWMDEKLGIPVDELDWRQL